MKKNVKKQEAKVYKTNTELLKKVIIGIVIIFVGVVVLYSAKSVLGFMKTKIGKRHDMGEYNFSIKIPIIYEKMENTEENNDRFGLNTYAFETEMNVQINQEYVNRKPEIVYSGRNSDTGVSLMIQCLKTEPTTRSLDDIAASNHALITIFYEDDYKIGKLQKEYIKVLDSDAVKTIIDITNKDGIKTFVTYMIPLKDKEITINFLGKKEKIYDSMKEIEKIVYSLK